MVYPAQSIVILAAPTEKPFPTPQFILSLKVIEEETVEAQAGVAARTRDKFSKRETTILKSTNQHLIVQLSSPSFIYISQKKATKH